MTTIKLTCEGCGKIELAPWDIHVRFRLDDEQWSYYFQCPHCGLRDNKQINGHMGRLLERSGCDCEPWTWPAELDEPHTGPPITLDDLIDLMVELEQGVM